MDYERLRVYFYHQSHEASVDQIRKCLTQSTKLGKRLSRSESPANPIIISVLQPPNHQVPRFKNRLDSVHSQMKILHNPETDTDKSKSILNPDRGKQSSKRSLIKILERNYPSNNAHLQEIQAKWEMAQALQKFKRQNYILKQRTNMAQNYVLSSTKLNIERRAKPPDQSTDMYTPSYSKQSRSKQRIRTLSTPKVLSRSYMNTPAQPLVIINQVEIKQGNTKIKSPARSYYDGLSPDKNSYKTDRSVSMFRETPTPKSKVNRTEVSGSPYRERENSINGIKRGLVLKSPQTDPKNFRRPVSAYNSSGRLQNIAQGGSKGGSEKKEFVWSASAYHDTELIISRYDLKRSQIEGAEEEFTKARKSRYPSKNNIHSEVIKTEPVPMEETIDFDRKAAESPLAPRRSLFETSSNVLALQQKLNKLAATMPKIKDPKRIKKKASQLNNQNKDESMTLLHFSDDSQEASTFREYMETGGNAEMEQAGSPAIISK